jgi:hypothetical protein
MLMLVRNDSSSTFEFSLAPHDVFNKYLAMIEELRRSFRRKRNLMTVSLR